MSRKIEEKREVYSLVSSGALMAVDYMSAYYEKNKTLKVDTLNSQWADLPSVFKDVKMGNGSFSTRYEHANNVTGKKEIIYGITDEERKININYADRDVFKRLVMNTTGIHSDKALALADNIIDWRDTDDKRGPKTPATSEEIRYKNSGIKYVPRNLPFKVVEEILLVDGMSFEIFSSIREYITVFGSSKININTASKIVLTSLGMSRQAVDQIILFRAGADMKEGSKDDNVFSSINSIAAEISVFGVLSQKDKEKLTDLIFMNILDVRSTCMRSSIVGSVFSGRMYGEIVCVFDKEGRIEYWGYRYYT